MPRIFTTKSSGSNLNFRFPIRLEPLCSIHHRSLRVTKQPILPATRSFDCYCNCIDEVVVVVVVAVIKVVASR